MKEHEGKESQWIERIVVIVIMLALPFAFFFLLSSKTGAEFGLSRISLSLIIGLSSALLLLWLKGIMRTRPYLGLIIGLLALAGFEYGLFQRYKGPYTLTFAVIGAAIVVIYLIINFVRFRAEETKTKGDEFED